MKTIFLTTLTAIAVFGFNSCEDNECQLCTKTSEPEVTICEEDYDSNTEYGLAIDALEVAGYECD